MKAFIRGEVFGDNARQQMQLCAKIVNMGLPGYGSWFFHCPSNTWAAEIIGFDKKFKYCREFLKGKRDYTYGNSNGSRGIYWEWILESGRIYEIKRQISWSSTERFFCVVDNNGDIVKLDEKDVIECLKRRSALMCLPQHKDVSLMCLTTSRASTFHLAEEKTAQ